MNFNSTLGTFLTFLQYYSRKIKLTFITCCRDLCSPSGLLYKTSISFLHSSCKIIIYYDSILYYHSRLYYSMSLKLYYIQVEGIKCTNCAGKIKTALTSEFPQLAKVTVNVIQERVYITLHNELLLPKIKETLSAINFHPIGEPALVDAGQSSERRIHLIYQQSNNKIPEIIEKFSLLSGVTKCIKTETTFNQKPCMKVSISYNYEIIKGRQIVDIAQSFEEQFLLYNQRVDGVKNKRVVVTKTKQLVVCISLICFFMLFNMILPETGHWYHDVLQFPSFMGVMSFLVIINICLTAYSINKFGKQFIINAYVNFRDYRAMNMETLIAIGSVSALGLFFFFFLRFSYLSMFDELQDKMMAIMQLIDALTSSTLIVLIVTIGKFLEKKVKKKIDNMTESIFPESQLFQDMYIDYVQLKNRNLMVLSQKVYHIDAIQKNDIIKLKPGRLLLDVIIINGKTTAVDSVMTGSEEEVEYEKGERIRSGSIIKSTNSLAQVENTFQKSVLLQIGAQINMAHNQQEANQIGIQAVCKKISNHFVKGVIFLSLIVVFVWTFLIMFEIVKVPTWGISWIVERGVGVLVASCPCALGLAVPSVLAIALNLAIKSGILIRKNIVFQKAKTTRIVAFDKTGTLFTKVQNIQEFQVFSDTFSVQALWQIVAVMQKQFHHPLAQVLYKQAFNKSNVVGTNFNFININKPTLENQGIVGYIRNKLTSENLDVKIGNKNLLVKYNIPVPQARKSQTAATALFLCVNREPCLVMNLNTHSNLRPEAKQIVRKLAQLGKEVHILSGDSSESVQKLGNILEIPVSQQHPEQSAIMKMELIKTYQRQQSNGVMMIGDGLNDIPCLQESSIGVSINAKSELNLNAADVIILSENLHKIVTLFRLLNKSNLFININLFWSFAYNVAIIPVVAGCFYGLDVYISPVWSSIAMSVSSLVVVMFSHLLVCFKYDDSLEIDQKNIQSLVMIPDVSELKQLPTASTKTAYNQLQDEL